uniref:Leucine rich immune protein (Coil-less) n=1 Tax=Anopheles dirus TaxID=7168 RepID=A0A182NHX7_9DIPT
MVQSAPQLCTVQGAGCTYDKLNLSYDGLQRLRASARQLPEMFVIQVDRLITPFPDGVLLQLVAEFVVEVAYKQYYERVLRIPPTSGLSSIELESAPQLEAITVVAPNEQLTSLKIVQGRIRQIPESFLNLRALMYLTIRDTDLETLSLDPFANSPNLTTLLAYSNKVRFLEVSQNPDLLIPLDDLSLSDNLLETVDGAFFLPLKRLTYLNLESNLIRRIEGRPISLPLVRYITLMDNQLLALNFTRWYVPDLVEIFLTHNNLTRIPVGMERLPKLITLVLANNLLYAADLRRLEGWNHLTKIDLSNNQLRTVMVSGSGRLALPNLLSVVLPYNQLTRLDYARWDFPKLNSLTLAYNQLSRLPNLVQMFPTLWRAIVVQNPLTCSTVRQWQQSITDYKLTVDMAPNGAPCTVWNGTVTLPSGRVACCVA